MIFIWVNRCGFCGLSFIFEDYCWVILEYYLLYIVRIIIMKSKFIFDNINSRSCFLFMNNLFILYFIHLWGIHAEVYYVLYNTRNVSYIFESFSRILFHSNYWIQYNVLSNMFEMREGILFPSWLFCDFSLPSHHVLSSHQYNFIFIFHIS